MKEFLITVKANMPYPKDFIFRVKATSMATASARAVKLFRKAIPKKRINELTIYIRMI